MPGVREGRETPGRLFDGKDNEGREEGSEGFSPEGPLSGGRPGAGRLRLGRLRFGRFGDGRALGRLTLGRLTLGRLGAGRATPLGRPPPRFGILGRAAGRPMPPPRLIPPPLKPPPASAFAATTKMPMITAMAVRLTRLFTNSLPRERINCQKRRECRHHRPMSRLSRFAPRHPRRGQAATDRSKVAARLRSRVRSAAR